MLFRERDVSALAPFREINTDLAHLTEAELAAMAEVDALTPGNPEWSPLAKPIKAALNPIAFVLLGGLVAGSVGAGVKLADNPTCTFSDGTTVDGQCMFSDEFTGSTLDSTKWIAEDDLISALLEHGAPFGCVASSNVSVTGGNLALAFTSNSRASCPATWSPNAYYNTHFAASFPAPTATSFDGAIVDAKTFKMKYGRISVRMKMPGGTGPTADVSLWGENCQSGGAGHQLMLGLFNNSGSCLWPQPGAREFDIPNYTHSNFDGKQIISGLHTDNNNGAPFLRNFSVGDVTIPYYGADWAPANTPVGNTHYLCDGITTDPTAAFHTFDTDWRPGQWSFFIDGQLCATNIGAWIPAENMFPMIWNVDQVAPSATGLPVSLLVDYVHIWCPPGVPCVWSS